MGWRSVARWMLALALAIASTPAFAQPVTTQPATAQPVARAPGYELGPEEPPRFQERFTLGIGLYIAGSESAWTHVAFTGFATARAPGVPAPLILRGRAFVGKGGTVQSDWSGTYSLYGVGAEALACTGHQTFCGVLGADVGHAHADLHDDNNGGTLEGDRSGPIVGPRFGLELGTERARFALIVDRYRWKTHHDPSRWMSHGGVTFSVSARF